MTSARTIIAIVAICGIASSASAKIWQVNSNSGVTVDFATVQAAHDGAASGDTLYVAGSPTTYGDLTAEKTLYIFGPGYFLDENPGNQASNVSCTIGTVNFNAGSERTQMSGTTVDGVMTVNTDNIAVLRNRISVGQVLTGTNVANLTFGQNYVSNLSVGSGSNNILIFNNFFTQSLLSPVSSSAEVVSNVFTNSIQAVSNSTVRNNIVISTSATGPFTGTGNEVSNNIGGGAEFGTENGNQSNVDMSTVFVATGSTDGKWQLAVGSPAIGAGFNGVDIGMFGGSTPYVLSGIPAIPTIYSFDAPAIGTTGGGLAVNMSIKSRN